MEPEQNTSGGKIVRKNLWNMKLTNWISKIQARLKLSCGIFEKTKIAKE